jgi:predicted dehydrogenase
MLEQAEFETLIPSSKISNTDRAPDRTLKAIAVVGLGYWGPNWVRNLNQSRCAERIVACDLSPERRDHIKQLYPRVEVTADLQEVFRDPTIEGVILATPVSSHYRFARQCLEADKSVLVEKPLAMSHREAVDLVKLARARDRILMVGHTFEYSAPVRKMRDIIASGEIGEVLYISSVRANLGLFQRDVNVTWDLAAHDISIILMLLGELPEAVSCQGQSHYCKNVEDVALLTLRMPRDVIAFIHVSWLDPNKIRRATVVGSKKMLVYDDLSLGEKIRIYDKGVSVARYYDTFGEFQFSYRYGDVYIPNIEETEPLKIECEHFVQCISRSSTPNTDGLSGLRVVSVLEAANLSLRNGGQLVPLIFANGDSDG